MALRRKKAFIHIDINATEEGMQPKLQINGIDKLKAIAILSLMQRALENAIMGVDDKTEKRES